MYSCIYSFIWQVLHITVLLKDLQKALENATVKIKVLAFKITYDVVCLCFISSS